MEAEHLRHPVPIGPPRHPHQPLRRPPTRRLERFAIQLVVQPVQLHQRMVHVPQHQQASHQPSPVVVPVSGWNHETSPPPGQSQVRAFLGEAERLGSAARACWPAPGAACGLGPAPLPSARRGAPPRSPTPGAEGASACVAGLCRGRGRPRPGSPARPGLGAFPVRNRPGVVAAAPGSMARSRSGRDARRTCSAPLPA